ncbi:MAG: CCA tRNA nucleotidyltransferase [Deltaproteobacteria bacterium]|nr:CCA tRNA nucleotidyltransferase [Deltaproteobacteria bacterium]
MLTGLPAYFPTCEGAYLVGGCVRDLLLGRPPADYDVAVLEDPRAYAQKLAAAAGGRIVEIGKPEFRLWRVAAPGGIVDVSAAAGAGIAQDLRQRDFTINALAVDIATGTIIDVTGGRQDLNAGTIRMVSAAAFRNDPVRLIRAFRLQARFGFSIEPGTLAAIGRDAGRIARPAGERVREEFFKMLGADRSAPALQGMARTGLLTALFPELKRAGENVLERAVATHQQLESLLADLPGCFPDTAEVLMGELTENRRILIKCAAVLGPVPGIPAIAQRLRLSGHDAGRLGGLIRHHPRAIGILASPRPSPREVTRFFREAHAALPDLLLNAAADLMAEPAGRSQDIRSHTAELLQTYAFAYLPRFQSPPPISGNDLIAEFGLKPSALFKQILDSIEEERLSRSEMGRAEALEMVRAYLKNQA